MAELALGADVIRIWPLAEAPLEFRKACRAMRSAAGRWVAHVPCSLLEEPLVALLGLPNSPLQTIFLADGSRLLSGALAAPADAASRSSATLIAAPLSAH